jgi:ribosomal protein S18 acetylase RimI-like enzyme
MKIRKARKSDWEEYSNMKEHDFKEYGELIGHEIKYSKDESKKEFDRILKSKSDFLILAEDKSQLAGFIHGVIEINAFSRKGKIEYIFISNNFRKKGLATKLINEFYKILKLKKINYVNLKVNVNNIGAIKLYKKLGFETTNYIMRKRLR